MTRVTLNEVQEVLDECVITGLLSLLHPEIRADGCAGMSAFEASHFHLRITWHGLPDRDGSGVIRDLDQYITIDWVVLEHAQVWQEKLIELLHDGLRFFGGHEADEGLHHLGIRVYDPHPEMRPPRLVPIPYTQLQGTFLGASVMAVDYTPLKRPEGLASSKARWDAFMRSLQKMHELREARGR